MCLYSFIPCRAQHPNDLARDLKSPTPDIVAAGVMRCSWYKAVANHDHHPSVQSTDEHVPQSGVKFPDGKDICPYLVIRHDEYVFDEDLQRIAEAVLMGGFEESDRGCQRCWDVITEKGWVGDLPGEAEKMEYLYTTNQVEDDWGHGVGSSAGTEGRSSGLKRGHEEETFYGVTASEYTSAIAERALKRRRKENLKGSLREVRSTSPSVLSEFYNSMSPEPPTSESEPAPPMAPEDSLIANLEVIPPRPDKINKSESEDYEIHATSNLPTWNLCKDPLFQNIPLKGRSNGKRRSIPPPQEEDDEEDPLQASRRQMAAGLEANMRSQLSSTEEGDALAVESALVPVGDKLARPPSTTVTRPAKSTIGEVGVGGNPGRKARQDPTLEPVKEEVAETVDASSEVTELRREVTQLRSRVAALLEENAAAAQREAELLRKLSKHEG